MERRISYIASGPLVSISIQFPLRSGCCALIVEWVMFVVEVIVAFWQIYEAVRIVENSERAES